MSGLLHGYLFLGAAIGCEVIGTIFLQKSVQFTRVLPSVMVLILYGASFYLLSHAIKQIPLGLAYAIWAGVGIVVTAVIALVVFGQSLDFGAMAGIALIVAGVIVVNLFSNTLSH